MNDRLRALESAVRGGGEVALRQFGGIVAERKKDRSIVTEADRAVERYLIEHLDGLVPGARILGEEGTSRRELWRGEPTWAIDPIDGTAVFVAGIATWSISVGLIQDGVAVMGCVFVPVSGEMFLADREGPMWWNGVAVDRRAEPGLLAAGVDSEAWIGLPSDHHRRYRVTFPAKVRSLGSTAAHVAWTARGVSVGTVCSARLWDVAGALALCRAAGIAGTYLSGAPIEVERLLDGEHTPEPMLFAHPADLEQVRGCLERLPRS